jgi:hypothetical protein
MRRKRSVSYFITTYSDYWFVNGKEWKKRQDIGDNYRSFTNGAFASTYKKAKKIALKCPAEMIIIKRYYRHGIPYEIDIVIKAIEEN